MTTERRRRPAVAPASRVLATGSAVAATLLLVGAMAEDPVDVEADATAVQPVVLESTVVPASTAPPVVTVAPSGTVPAPPSASTATVRVAVPTPAAAPAAPAPVPVTASHGSR
jgi:hypothetical protein